MEMEQEIEYRWLPHLEDAVPPAGQGKRISTYTVSLEGWRRGLQLNFYSVFEDGNKLKVRYSLSNEDRTHHFQLSMGDKVSDEAFDICDDKDLTKQYLEKHNVPVPKGDMFDENSTDEEIVKYGMSLGFPLVVKPTDGNAGKGVFANIKKEKDLRNAISHVRDVLEYPEIIVEKYISGEEFRIFVIEDKVLGAMNRRPASVTGDGVQTIRQLIHEKNRYRKINPHLTSRLIRIDIEIENRLESKGYTLNAIPKEGELISLRQKSNLSTGGDAVNVTDEMTQELNEIAINAGKAIPGLTHYGVDMIVSNDRKKGVILEVNSRPGIGGHLFPGEGEPVDFAKDIIDYYFPETKDIERSLLYYDFDSVLEPITARTASNVDVIAPPLGKLYGKKYIITGDFNKRDFSRYILRQARLFEVHGHIEHIEDEKMELIVVGKNEQVILNFRNICYEALEEDETIENIEESDWYKPIKMGFERILEKELTKSEIRDLIIQRDNLQREKEYILKKYNEIHKSRAWKATFPVRFILQRLKTRIRSIKN